MVYPALLSRYYTPDDFLFRVFERCFRSNGTLNVEVPVVGGRIPDDEHISWSMRQLDPSILRRVRLLGVIGSKLKGPNKFASKWRSETESPHCMYLSPFGSCPGRNNIRAPNTISLETVSLVYLYQSGHHLLYSSLFRLSSGCLAKKLQ